MKTLTVFLSACLFAGPAIAQDDSRLMSLLNGTGWDNTVTFNFERTGCKATSTILQKVEGSDLQTSVTEFDLGDLNLNDFKVLDIRNGDLAQLELGPKAGGTPFALYQTLATSRPDLHKSWESAGARCENNLCEFRLSGDKVALIVAGPEAGLQVEFVLSDLTALAADCPGSAG